MTSKAQSEGIPQDTAPSRYSLASIARNVSIFLFLCGMIAVQLQPTQNLSGERAHQTGVVNEDLLNTVQLKAPLVNAVKGIRAHRRLLSEDQEELDGSEYPSKSTRRLKGKGGRGRNGGRSKGRSGKSKGKKGRSKGSKGSGRFSRSQTFSPFPTETPFPTSTPFPTVTPFPTITPYPTATPWPTWTPFPTTFAGNSPPPTPTTTVVTTAPTTVTTAPSPPGATVAPTASTTAPTAATA